MNSQVFRISRPYNQQRRIAKRDLGKALVIFYDVSARHDIDARTLRDGASRWPEHTAARREFCMLARAAGLNYAVIAQASGLDHTSVYWHTIDDERRRKQNRVRARAYLERSRACRAA